MVFDNIYDCTADADAVVICTEWDEFRTADYERIYNQMKKPAFLFDGRSIVDGARLKKIGFEVEVIGKKI